MRELQNREGMFKVQKWSKRWLAGGLVVFLVGSLFLISCGKEEEKKAVPSTAEPGQAEFKPLDTHGSKVVAKYNGGEVTEGALNLYINIVSFFNPQLAMMLSDPALKDKENELKGEVAKQLASQLYIANKIKSDTKLEKEVDASLKEIEGQLKQDSPVPGEKAPKNLEEAIKGKGFTKDQLRTFVIQDHKIQAYYEQQQGKFNQQLQKETYVEVKANHILVAVDDKRNDATAKKRAEEVKKKLEAGGDFTKLAKEYSDDPGSKESGGLVEGPMDRFVREFVPPFTQAVKTLPLNKISDPVKTEYGYHVIKVTKRQSKSFDQAPEDVKQEKIQQIFQEQLDKELQFKLLFV
jgi:foldase protein PrsA